MNIWVWFAFRSRYPKFEIDPAPDWTAEYDHSEFWVTNIVTRAILNP